MAIQVDDNFKGVPLTGAYMKALVSVDVAIYANEEERVNGNVLGNKTIDLSDDSMAQIYQIIKDEAYPDATDLLEDSWKVSEE